MNWKPFSFSKLLRSSAYALSGVIFLLNNEQNARVHAVNTILVAVFAYIFETSRIETAILFIAVLMVFVVEIINTAIERVFDVCHPDQHPVIKKAKDAMAGAVLISAVISATVEIIIFLPYILRLFN